MSALTISHGRRQAVPALAAGTWPMDLELCPLPSSHHAGSELGSAAGTERHIQATMLVARKAKSSVMRLDQLLLQLSRARPDNQRVSRDAGYQTQVPNPPAAQCWHPVWGALAAPGCPDSINFFFFFLLTSFPAAPFLCCFNYYYIIIFYLSCPTRTGEHSCLPGRAAAGTLHGRRTTVLYIEEM